jgi:hypothetical protein
MALIRTNASNVSDGEGRDFRRERASLILRDAVRRIAPQDGVLFFER